MAENATPCGARHYFFSRCSHWKTLPWHRNPRTGDRNSSCSEDCIRSEHFTHWYHVRYFCLHCQFAGNQEIGFYPSHDLNTMTLSAPAIETDEAFRARQQDATKALKDLFVAAEETVVEELRNTLGDHLRYDRHWELEFLEKRLRYLEECSDHMSCRYMAVAAYFGNRTLPYTAATLGNMSNTLLVPIPSEKIQDGITHCEFCSCDFSPVEGSPHKTPHNLPCGHSYHYSCALIHFMKVKGYECIRCHRTFENILLVPDFSARHRQLEHEYAVREAIPVLNPLWPGENMEPQYYLDELEVFDAEPDIDPRPSDQPDSDGDDTSHDICSHGRRRPEGVTCRLSNDISPEYVPSVASDGQIHGPSFDSDVLADDREEWESSPPSSSFYRQGELPPLPKLRGSSHQLLPPSALAAQARPHTANCPARNTAATSTSTPSSPPRTQNLQDSSRAAAQAASRPPNPIASYLEAEGDASSDSMDISDESPHSSGHNTPSHWILRSQLSSQSLSPHVPALQGNTPNAVVPRPYTPNPSSPSRSPQPGRVYDVLQALSSSSPGKRRDPSPKAAKSKSSASPKSKSPPSFTHAAAAASSPTQSTLKSSELVIEIPAFNPSKDISSDTTPRSRPQTRRNPRRNGVSGPPQASPKPLPRSEPKKRSVKEVGGSGKGKGKKRRKTEE